MPRTLNPLIIPRKVTHRDKTKACSTGYSQAVTHPSTRPARHWLTSVIGREPVYSAWYGRRHFSLRIGEF